MPEMILFFYVLWRTAMELTKRRPKTNRMPFQNDQMKGIDFLDAMTELVIYQDKQMRVLWVNRAAGDSVGRTPEQLLGLHCYEIWPQRDRPCEGCPVVRAQESGRPCQSEITTPDGRIWQISAYPVRDRQERITGLLEVVLEITERKRAEQALQESEYRFRSIVESTHEAIGSSGPDGRIITANPAMARMLGLRDPEDLIGVPAVNLYVDPNDRLEFFTELKAKGYVENFELILVKQNGRRQPLHILGNATLHADESGHVERIDFIFSDITERKQAEKALQESEERYRTITENINVGIYRNTPGPQGRFLEANPAIVSMFGYNSKEEFIGTPVSELYQEPGRRQMFNGKMLQNGFVRNEEILLKRKDGSPFWGSVTAVAVKDDRNEVKYYDGVIEDITERKRAQEERQKNLEKLQSLLEGIIHTMSVTVETRDRYTAGHQRRVAILARTIAQEMNLPEEKVKAIYMAALIHDIGKIAIPAEILSKPTKLNEVEYSIIKTHPQVGYDILKGIDFPWPIADLILKHHERLDGSGYPRGLLGTEIPLEARILSVADVVEAMASHRPYRAALGIGNALEEITQNKGKLYDPEVVKVCLKIFYDHKFKWEQ
jgi:PAS domain S-box-containing protein/putative nucleotidyltransferase with HDIG domain